MELPPPLQPWSSLLGLFPEEVALGLGPWVRRLAAAIGPLRMDGRRGAGEPDGFDGLDRRGSYERLLASEWLLRDEAPDEFTRRAAAGEHAFLRLARREPARSRASLALFDAGPSQLGAPRIAHLAALIVLSRRAEAAGARFAWGVLQEPEALVPEVTAAGVQRLLEARTAFEAGEDDLDLWRARPEAAAADDLWLVGAARLARLQSARGAARLEVRDVLEPGVRRLLARVRPAGAARPAAELALELPDDRLCARLLRAPFAPPPVAPTNAPSGTEPASALVFASNGHKLLARAPDGAVVSYPIPNSPRAMPGRPRRHPLAVPPHLALVPAAVGWQRRSLVVVTAAEGRVLVLGQRAAATLFTLPEGVAFCAPDAQGPLGSCHPLMRDRSQTCAWLVPDATGALFQLGSEKSAAEGRVLSSRVTALAPVPRGVAYVARRDEARPGEAPWHIVVHGRDGTDQRFDLWGDGSFAAFFGFAGGLPSPSHYGLLAVQADGATWSILHGGRTEQVALGSDVAAVAGVACDGRSGEPALLVLRDDRRTLALVGPRAARALPAASAPIAYAAASYAAPHVAYATTGGETVVYSLDHEAVVFRAVRERPR